MVIGIIGSGRIGGTLASRLSGAGHRVTVANSRGPESLADLVAGLGPNARAGTVTEAAGADVVIVAIPLARVDALPADAVREGAVVVDANNYYPDRDGRIADLDEERTTSSELLAARLPSARVVKAFNTMFWERLRDEGRPDAPADERLAIPVAGDDAEAKRRVAGLIDDLGFTAVDHGDLAAGRRQQPGTPVYNRPLTPAEARGAIERAG